jgi:hypothetical protein
VRYSETATIVWALGRTAERSRLDDLSALFEVGPTLPESAGIAAPYWAEAQSSLSHGSANRLTGRLFVLAGHKAYRILSGTELLAMNRDGR